MVQRLGAQKHWRSHHSVRFTPHIIKHNTTQHTQPPTINITKGVFTNGRSGQ